MPAEAPALALFDIDGTLVRRSGPHHREVLVDAVRRVTGLETTTDGIPVHGMLDPDILTAMMQAVGAPRAVIRRAMPEIVTRAQNLYVRRVPDLQEKTCPGVPEVLEKIRSRGLLLGLVTGNLTRIGWKKLEKAGLKRYFRFGAFGEMAPDRSGLVRIAVRRARAEGWIGKRAPVAMIGDAPSDVIAAKANRVKAIAVATGLSPAEELRGYGPDILLGNLTELEMGELV
ncbi:MAG TPA: HAD family hydrolase [Bryobacteraceae bacterium]|nr:HAD family hydrolase [Bryobacteraceae bacterium]